MKKLSLLLTMIFVSSAIFSQTNQKMNLEDIVNYVYWPNSVYGVRSMNDGEHFSVYSFDRASQHFVIKKFEYKSGDEIETIVDLTALGVGNISWDYQFSSDEKKLLLYADKESIYRHSFLANYYVYDLDTKKVTKVSERGKQQIASFSPNADKVAFVRDNNLFIKDLSNGDEKQITSDGEKNKILNGVPDWVYEEEFGFNKAYEWSPDGNNLAYIKFNESKVKQFTILEYAGEAPHNSEYELYPGLYQYKYPKAGEDNSTVGVYIYNVSNDKTVEAKIPNNNDIYIPAILWNTVGTDLIIEKLNREQNHLELLKTNPQTGATSLLLEDKNKYYIGDETYRSIYFTQDGQHIILMSERDGYRHLYSYNSNGVLENQITKGDWDVIDFLGFDAKKGIVYYQSAESSPINRDIYSIKLDGKKKKKINTTDGTNNIEFSKNFKYYILNFSDGKTPNYITLHNSKGNILRVLEDNEQLKIEIDKIGGMNKNFFSFKTSEGVELNAYRIVPPDFDEKKVYPVIVTQYSGPNSQQVLNKWRFDWQNYMAQQGFVIVCVDTRGTGGRGEAFRKVTYKNLGKYETIDLVETAKYLGNLSYIDKNRIGIWGWSYGGFMVLNALTKGNGIFRAGVAVAPVTNWRYYDNIYTERYMRKPQDNANGYDDNSPLNFASNLQGELFLAFGTADDNVHPQNSFEFIAKLIEANKEFTTLPYPNRNHGIYGGNTSLHLYSAKTKFFIKHLLGK